MICGNCVNWRCDDCLHLQGYCTVDRNKRFHGEMCDTCTKYDSKWEYRRPVNLDIDDYE